MGQFVSSIRQVSKNYKTYDAWEQKQADIRVQKEALAKKQPLSAERQEELKKRAETVIRATEIMDARSEDNCENMEQLTGMLAIIPSTGIILGEQPLNKFIDKKINQKYKPKLNQLEKLVRNEDKNISANAKKELEQLSKKYKTALNRSAKCVSLGGIAAVFASAVFMILWGNKKQKEASRIGRFQAKQNELSGLENFVAYTPEQIEQAQKIAKGIPDEKERKSILKMISELKAVNRDKSAYKKWLAQKDPDELEKLKQPDVSPKAFEKAKEDKELIVNTVKEINIKAEEYSENLENAYDTFSNLSWLLAVPLGFGINALLKACKVNPKYNKLASILTPLMVTLGIGIHGTIAQKQAARVGRFKARKDLTENPALLTAYSDKDMESVKDIKADNQKLGFFRKLGQNFKFIKTYSKDKKEYKKYKKTTQKQNEKLQKAFKKIETTEQQKKEAKLLQTNVFRAFDEVDEMSQRYSEDVEAGCEIAKQSVSTIWSLASLGAIALVTAAFFSGKLPITKWCNKLVNMTFDKNSSIKKSVNGLQEILSKKDKKVVQEFQKSIADSMFSKNSLKTFINKTENADIKQALESIFKEFGDITTKGISDSISTKTNFGETTKNLFSGHLKQTRFAKWLRNLIGDISKLVAKSKSSKAGMEIPKEMQETLGLNFNYKNYKTLINTSIIGFVPIFGAIFSVPYAFNAWLTNIQKKAGKIGVMQAVNNLDNPKIFAEQNN